MLEAGLDFGLRCTLIGHRNPRPEYGDGGSLTYRREELLKLAHPVSDALLRSYPLNGRILSAYAAWSVSDKSEASSTSRSSSASYSCFRRSKTGQYLGPIAEQVALR